MKVNKFSKLILIFGILSFSFSCKYFGINGGINESTNPKVAVQTALINFLEVNSYHSVTNTKNAELNVETQIDFIAPNKYWIRNNLPGRANETIAIGNDSYSRINIGKWTKTTVNEENSFSEIRGKLSEEALAAMKDFEAVGKEILNGKETFVYTFKSTSSGESSSKMWVDAKRVLPLRVDTEGTYNGSNIQMSIIYDYDKEINIEAPQMD